MIEQYTETNSDVVTAKSDNSSRDGDPTLVVAVIDKLTLLALGKWLIAKITGVAVLLGILTTLVLPTRYTAVTKLMTPQQTQPSAAILMNQLTNSAVSSLASAGSGLGLRNPNDIYVGFLTSRTVADPIIEKFGLVRIYRVRDQTAARKKLADNTVVASEKSGFISISVTDKDRKLAADIANSYTDQLRFLTKSLAVTEASRRRIFYEDQLKRAREDLITAEISFRRIQQQKGLVQLDEQAKAVIMGLSSLRAQIAAKQVELRALRSYSTDSNPGVQLAESELDALQAEATRLEQHTHSSAPTDIGLQDVAGAGIEYLRAAHELQYRQTLLDLLIKQYDIARLDEAKDAAIIQVVESATPPDRKSSPHLVRVMMLFTFFGFLVGCLYLIVSDAARENPEVSQSLAGFWSVLLHNRS